ncbi:hypothetical protein Tco_1536916 [Tanacetum coccineum]
MFDEHLNPPPSVDHQVPIVPALEPVISTGTPLSTTIDQDAPSTSTSQTTLETLSPVVPLGVEEADHDIEVAHMDNNPFTEAMQEELNEFERLEVWEYYVTYQVGMLTRAMAKQLSAASAHECLFVDFLFKEEPKKVSEALKHPG